MVVPRMMQWLWCTLARMRRETEASYDRIPPPPFF